MKNIKEIYESFLLEVHKRIYHPHKPLHFYIEDELHLSIDILGMEEMDEFNKLCKKFGLSYILDIHCGPPEADYVKAVLYDNR